MNLLRRYKKFYFFTYLIFIILFYFFLIKDKGLFADETQYFNLINQIKGVNVNKELLSQTTSLPGYAFMISSLRSIFNFTSLGETRFLTLFISLASIFSFFVISKALGHKYPYIKTLQYLFFPLIFIFLFLIYTDIFSLLLVILSFYFAFNKKYLISAIFLFLSILVRQNNIIWILFLVPYIYFEKYKLKINKNNLIGFIRIFWPYLFPVMFMVLFLIYNKGIAVGSMNNTAQPISLHFANIYLSLFLFFFLFLPTNIKNFPKVLNLLKKNLILLLLIALGFIFYLFTFKVDHFWNGPQFNFFLRNFLLNVVVNNFYLKLFFFFPVIYSILSLMIIPLRRKSFYFLYPVSLIFLSLSWLIEPRYYIISFTLFLLFKKEESISIERLTAIYFIIISNLIFAGTINRMFFI